MVPTKTSSTSWRLFFPSRGFKYTWDNHRLNDTIQWILHSKLISLPCSDSIKISTYIVKGDKLYFYHLIMFMSIQLNKHQQQHKSFWKMNGHYFHDVDSNIPNIWNNLPSSNNLFAKLIWIFTMFLQTMRYKISKIRSWTS